MQKETAPDSPGRDRPPQRAWSDGIVYELSSGSGRVIQRDGLNLCFRTQGPEETSKPVYRNPENQREPTLGIDDTGTCAPYPMALEWVLETTTRRDAEFPAIRLRGFLRWIMAWPVPNGALAG